MFKPNLRDNLNTNIAVVSDLNIQCFNKHKFNKIPSGIPIGYDYINSIFGKVVVALNSYGICHLGFYETHTQFVRQLKLDWPKSIIEKKNCPKHSKRKS